MINNMVMELNNGPMELVMKVNITKAKNIIRETLIGLMAPITKEIFTIII